MEHLAPGYFVSNPTTGVWGAHHPYMRPPHPHTSDQHPLLVWPPSTGPVRSKYCKTGSSGPDRTTNDIEEKFLQKQNEMLQIVKDLKQDRNNKVVLDRYRYRPTYR